MSSVDWLPFCLGVNVLLKNFQGHYTKWHKCHQLGALLSHWGRVEHICVSEIIIIGSDDDLSPDRRQAIIWTNAGILLIGPLGTNFNEILIKHFHSRNRTWKCRLWNGVYFVSPSMC